MAKSHSSTGGPTPQNEEAVWPMTEVGGVRSSVDPAPGLWFGENAEERRDATCSAAGESNEGCGDGLFGGYQRPKQSGSCEPRLARRFPRRERNSESRMRENRPSGLMRGGKQTVIGLVPLNPSLPAYSTLHSKPCGPALIQRLNLDVHDVLHGKSLSKARIRQR